MNILGVQLILVFFALFMMYVIYLHWKKRTISNLMFSGWFFIWVIFIVLSLFPKILEPLLRDLFVVRVMDLGMIGAFMVLAYLTIDNNIRIREYENQLEKLVRKLSVKQIR